MNLTAQQASVVQAVTTVGGILVVFGVVDSETLQVVLSAAVTLIGIVFQVVAAKERQTNAIVALSQAQLRAGISTRKAV